MVIPAPDSNPLEIRGADGQVIGYIVSAEQMSRLRGEVASLREQISLAVQMRDHYFAKCEELFKTRFPLPPSPGEMATPQATSDDITRLIADLESR